MMNRNSLEQFIGREPLSKTIRNSLIPSAETARNIETKGIIGEDELRAEKRQQLKEIMDDYYRSFITEKLLTMHDIEWQPLFSALEDTMNERLKQTELEKVQSDKRKEIHKYFADDERFKIMFNAKFLTDLLPGFIMSNPDYKDEERDEKLQTVKLFSRFCTSFVDFFNNRKNAFSLEAIATSVCHRIVNDNAEIYWRNMCAFKCIERKLPDEIPNIEIQNADTLREWSLAQIYSVSFYAMALTQDGIEYYNDICGKINSYMNLYCQKHKLNRNEFRMKKLHKQILCIASSYYEIPFKFESDQQVYEAVNKFIKNAQDKNIMERCMKLGQEMERYDFNKVYISQKNYESVSKYLYGQWNVLDECLKMYFMEKLPGKSDKKVEKAEAAVKKDAYRSIAEIDMLTSQYDPQEKGDVQAKEYISKVCDIVQNVKLTVLEYNDETKLLEDKRKASELKNVLDIFMNILHWGEAFLVSEMVDKECDFYPELEEILEEIKEITPLYNHVRNYVTQKPYSTVKFKLNFGSPTLANGWNKSKEYDNNAVLLLRDGKFYLAIFNVSNKPDKKIMEGHQEERTGDYKKMIYNLLPGANKMLPKVFLTSKSGQETYKPSKYILDGYKRKLHIKSSADFDIRFCRDLINYFKDCIDKHPDWKKFHFQFSDTESYEDISGFYREVERQGYRIEWTYISEEDIQQLDQNGQIYFFQIYNKDFSEKSTGKENLHTMYLKNLFSEENLKNIVLKLNGEAEIFFRKSSVKKQIKHEKGSILVNKSYIKKVNGKEIRVSIPEKEYIEIYNHLNKKGNGILSEQAQEYEKKVRHFRATKVIVKDYRYCCDRYFLHLPITINFQANADAPVNDKVLEYIAANKDIHIIGIDRGERNLLYLTIIDSHGRLEEQYSFNIVDGYDYQEKLKDREKSRDAARKNWNEIEKIKELKEGYLSNVIHKITELIVEKNAIVVMEDLNYGFKRGRFKVERQVYQKFETMLIKKLNYLVFKNKGVEENGGLLRGYQLTYVPQRLKDVGKQCGFIFYVPAGYTSKIDPTTGFVNVFNFKQLSTRENRKAFINKFDAIKYDNDKKMFVFSFDYNNFIVHNTTLAKTKWDAYTNGTRLRKIFRDGKYTEKTVEVDLTQKMAEILEQKGISYADGRDLKEAIVASDVEDVVIDLFKLTIQLRNSKSESEDREYDRLISPVLNDERKFFDTDESEDDLPKDADANGAYCIALKGLYEVKQIQTYWKENEEFPKDKLKLDNRNWFDFIQNKRYL